MAGAAANLSPRHRRILVAGWPARAGARAFALVASGAALGLGSTVSWGSSNRAYWLSMSFVVALLAGWASGASP